LEDTLDLWPHWPHKEGQYLRPSEGASVNDWGQNWNRDVIGLAEYNRKTALYYRAVFRLKARGFFAPPRLPKPSSTAVPAGSVCNLQTNVCT
jgi:hypothetical protein